MPYIHQATFSRGEISPELASRVDLELFRSGLAECTNFTSLKRGGIRRRGGTKYIGQAKDNDAARFIKFQFSLDQGYILEFGDYMFRVWTIDGRVGTVEVVTPYAIEDVRNIKYSQSGDVIYLAHQDYAPQKVSRLSDTSWTIEAIEFLDGPYLDLNVTATLLTPSATGHVTPEMTANNAPSGTVSGSYSSTDLYKLFDREKTTSAQISTGSEGWIQYDFGSGNSVVIDAYWITSDPNSRQYDDTPAQWEIQGSQDGTAWASLDSRDAETNWSGSETRFYEFANRVSYRYYRYKFSGGGGSDGVSSSLSEIAFHQSAETQTPFNLTASSVDGINEGDGFLSSDVGRHIRLRGSDGEWRWAKIISRVSSTVVTIVLYSQALPDLSPISAWRLGAWAENTGYPAAIGFYKDRLCFGGTRKEPLKVWQSQSGDYVNMGISSPLVASDAVSVPILSGSIDPIYWLSQDGDQIVGTESEIRRIGPEISTEPYGPENNGQDPAGRFGANSAQPPDMEPIFYWGRYGKDLREVFFDPDRNRFSSRSASEISHHLFLNGVNGGAYQQYPSSILWQWDEAGLLVGFTHEKDQQVFGFHKHTFQNSVVEWAEVITTDDFDEVWLLIKREIDGSTVRYFEVLQAPFENQDIEDAWHLDCAVLYEGTAANTISGLDHLEGEAIIMSTNGADYSATVSSGEASLPAGVTGTKILCGLNVDARAKLLRPAVAAQDGSSVGRKMKVASAYIDLYQTGSLRVGSDSTYRDEINFYRDGDTDEEAQTLKTGTYEITTEMRWDEDGQIVLEASGNKPATVLSINLNLSMEP